MPPTSPDRSSSQSTGYRIVCWICSGRVRLRVATVASSVRRLDRDRARTRARPRARRGTRASTCGSAPCAPAPSTWETEIRLADEQAAVADRERVAVERAHRRAGDAVALGVVLAAVARAAEARDRAPSGSASRRRTASCSSSSSGAVRLHRAAEVRAVVRDDREARLALEQPVVADERRPPRDLALAWSDMNVAITYLPSG